MSARKVILILAALLYLWPVGLQRARAESASPVQAAETLRSALFHAQMNLPTSPAQAQASLDQAAQAYATVLRIPIQAAHPGADEHIRGHFAALQAVVAAGSPVEFAASRARLWTALLEGSYRVIEHSIARSDMRQAQRWLGVREFRTATRFERPNADATLAIQQLLAGSLSVENALQFLHADLLDTYQARLNEALRDLESADQNQFPIRRAELAALAAGYFEILAPAYAGQRGQPALDELRAGLAALQSAALTSGEIPPLLEAVHAGLSDFRAAPLSPAEQSRRAGQLLRYLKLIPVEYGRGVAGGRVTQQFEIQEAVTFHEAAQAAFDDLRNLLSAQDPAATNQAAGALAGLGQLLHAASANQSVASPDTVERTTLELVNLLQATMPPAWQEGSTAGDFDVIQIMLDQMEVAVRRAEYDLAESARLEAYAILESGPEARLSVLAPQSKVVIEDLFWHGQGEHAGLAFLIRSRASWREIKASREALDTELAYVEELLSVKSAPLAVLSNAGIIVFREGLEAVVILASLMGSMKSNENRKYRRPMWAGALLALLATVATWVLAQTILSSLARYGEKLEALVSLVAIAVLLLITNWFFHKHYWTDWLASFHTQKRRLFSGEASLLIGLVSLGFTSVYREGFETVLFLQALVIESGAGLVLGGVAAGLLGTIIIGVIAFRLQARLPYMKMFVFTGILIGAVLLIMVGKTAHVLQVVGWIPTTPITGIAFPYWLGAWFGVYATWQGIGLQIAAAVFVLGSYYLAGATRKNAR